jgi:hypothetical protein
MDVLAGSREGVTTGGISTLVAGSIVDVTLREGWGGSIVNAPVGLPQAAINIRKTVKKRECILIPIFFLHHQ